MRKRDRHRTDGADTDPPVPEAQGDGEPAPADVRDRMSDAVEAGGAPGTDDAATAHDVDGDDPAQIELSQQLSEQRDKFLRLAAEYDNYRKRSIRERAEAAARGQAELVTRLLDALDDLQRFAHIEPATTDPQTLHKGIELVEQKMLKVLGAAGLEVVNPIDQTFDPTQHEAIATEPALSPEDDHTVGKVFQPGYRFNGQLLRPARVVVKQWNG